MSRVNPPVIPADTTVEAWRVQMAAAARRSVDERLAEWAAMNAAMAQLEADGVRRRHPDYSDRQVFLAMIRRRFPRDVVARLWPDAISASP